MAIKIFNAQQIREADSATIEQEPISSVELMERAAAAFVWAYLQMYDESRQVLIFCGSGNNGGDGLAIGRMLLDKQCKVQLYKVSQSGKASDDFNAQLDRLKEQHEPKEIREEAHIPSIPEGAVVIDALFGTGLSRPVQGLYAAVINKINESQAKVVSVDIPSGFYPDSPPDLEGAIVKADCAVTFEHPKLAFLLPESGRYLADWKVVDIGLSKDFLARVETRYFFTDQETIRRIYKPRHKWSHKGHFGKVLLIAGSKGKIGAGLLCARACLRSGVGLLTVYLPECGYEIMQTGAPEAMCMTDPETDHFSSAPDTEKFDVLAIGPGLGTAEGSIKALKDLLQQTSKPMVVDADGLNMLSKENELLEYLPENAVLTPHPKEFERLAGSWKNDFERLEKQQAFSREHKVVVVLKGAHTSISAPDGRVYFNSTGNPGMATGGTGDVLTGMIAALLGQQYNPFDAAVLGVFLQGLAADLAAKELGEEALIASDLINWLPQAFQKIRDPAFTITAQGYW